MRDRELYATILGVQAPWTVERVELDVAGGAVHVWLTRAEGAPAPCPECQTACPIYDHREREWRHLDTCQLQTRLHARVPRVECPTHGVLQSPIPWATPGSKFTLLFERLAIDWLREAAVPAVARQLGEPHRQRREEIMVGGREGEVDAVGGDRVHGPIPPSRRSSEASPYSRLQPSHARGMGTSPFPPRSRWAEPRHSYARSSGPFVCRRRLAD